MNRHDILAALVAFPTISRDTNLPLIEWVEDYLLSYGISATRSYDATGLKANLFATIGPADRPGYILSGHTDVVPVDGQDWASGPFDLTAHDGRLYGRGTCDMKGFLACCLAAVPALSAADLRHPIHLAFSYDEEVGCVGVRGLIAGLAGRPMLGCFVGEPTSMQVATGHKGKRSVRARATGLTCHSSLAPHGVNAVEWMARLVVESQRLGGVFAVGGARDELYDVPHTTVHVGTFLGRTALNIVPDEAEIVFEVRAVSADDPDGVVSQLIDFVRRELEPAMKRIAPQAGFDFEVYAGFPGLDIPADEPIVTLAKRLSGRNDNCKVAYGTEAGLFQQAGIPTVIIGPGSIEQAHKADEFIEVSQLDLCSDFIERLIETCRA